MKSRIWMALIAIYLAWGSTYLAIHYAIQSIPPFFMTGTRFLVAGLILFGWRRLAGDPNPTRSQWRSGIIIGSLLLVGGIGGLSWAEQFLPSGLSSLIVAASPLWIVLINALRPGGTRPSKMTLLGVLLGLAGMFILIDPWNGAQTSHGYNPLGVVILLLSALSWSVGSIYSRNADLPKSALMGTGVQLLAGSVGSYLIGLLTGEVSQVDLRSITLTSLGGLAYLIIVGSLIGFVCFTWLLRNAPTTLVVTHAYVNPLIAILLGSLLANEALTPEVLLSSLFILLAVGLIQTKTIEKKTVATRSLMDQKAVGD